MSKKETNADFFPKWIIFAGIFLVVAGFVALQVYLIPKFMNRGFTQHKASALHILITNNTPNGLEKINQIKVQLVEKAKSLKTVQERVDSFKQAAREYR